MKDYIDGHFREQYEKYEKAFGSKQACILTANDIQDLLKDNPDKGVILDLRGLNFGDDDLLTAIANIRLAVGKDHNRVVIDGYFSETDKYLLSEKLYKLSGERIQVTFRVDAKEEVYDSNDNYIV